MSLAQARAAADGAVERTAFELSRPRVAPDAWSRGRPAPHVDRRRHRADRDGVRRERPDRPQRGADAAAEGIAAERRRSRRRRPRSARWTRSSTGAMPMTSSVRTAPRRRTTRRPRLEIRADQRALRERRRVAACAGHHAVVDGRIARTLTIYSRQPGVNPGDGRPRRAARPAERHRLNRSTPSSPRATMPSRTSCRYRRSRRRRDSRGAASPVWRIHVVARTPDGVTFARDAVLRPLDDARRPLVTLLWQEGHVGPDVRIATATGKSAQENGTGKP